VDILDSLAKSIGNTPLYDISGLLGNTCRGYAKCEFKNPTGSHYDRAYLALFRDLEASGKIQRGKTHMVEVSSGSAGASFAWFCAQLGYESTVILPQGLPPGFEQHIRKQNGTANIVVSKHGDYIKGAVRTLREILVKNRDWVCPDHSRSPITLRGLAAIGSEAVAQLQQENVTHLDYWIAACGNGATLVGPGPILKRAWPTMKVVLFETDQAPTGYRNLHPDVPQKGGSYHKLYGTGGWDITLPFISDAQYGFRDFADDDMLISNDDLSNALELAKDLPFSVGNSSLVALWAARKVAQAHPARTLLTFFYDVGSKYGR